MNAQRTVGTRFSFGIADGPSTPALIKIAVCDLLNVDCPRSVVFRLKPHQYDRRIGTKIEAQIISIQKVGREKWVIRGNWLSTRPGNYPRCFVSEYLSNPPRGVLTFSFEYGNFDADDAGFAYCSERALGEFIKWKKSPR